MEENFGARVAAGAEGEFADGAGVVAAPVGADTEIEMRQETGRLHFHRSLELAARLVELVAQQPEPARGVMLPGRARRSCESGFLQRPRSGLIAEGERMCPLVPRQD